MRLWSMSNKRLMMFAKPISLVCWVLTFLMVCILGYFTYTAAQGLSKNAIYLQEHEDRVSYLSCTFDFDNKTAQYQGVTYYLSEVPVVTDSPVVVIDGNNLLLFIQPTISFLFSVESDSSVILMLGYVTLGFIIGVFRQIYVRKEQSIVTSVFVCSLLAVHFYLLVVIYFEFFNKFAQLLL